MDADKIIQDLNRRFAAPLQEFYKRRIIIWHDEEREFEDRISDISIPDVKILVLTDDNFFASKKLIGVDDTESNYLIYCPYSYDKPEDNWLLDIELYAEEFRADMVSMWMDEMGIEQTLKLRSGFKKYSKFFKAQGRRKAMVSLSEKPANISRLQLCIMSVLSGLKEVKAGLVIREVLKDSLYIEDNEIYQNFVNYEIDKAFWYMVSLGTGYREDEPNLLRLATHIFMTAASRTLRTEYLSDVAGFISEPHQAYCYDLATEWIHSEDKDSAHKVACEIEGGINIKEIFTKLDIEDIRNTEVFPCIDEVILFKLMNMVSDYNIDIDLIRETAEKRRGFVYYGDVRYFYEGLLSCADMQQFYRTHASGFHTPHARTIWSEYTSEYYLMDTYYRNFHKHFYDSLKNYHEVLSDPYTSVMEVVEGMYVNWFLGQLGKNWSDVCGDELEEHGKILEVPEQRDFYTDRVESADNRIYVIISDAMRYEVAVTLTEQLRREAQAKVKLDSVQGIFPTETKYGMAALLPHRELTMELRSGSKDRLVVLADGQSTEMNNRDKVLKSKNPNSVALSYKNIIDLKKADRQALIKGMEVVYIYHDTIDEAGHQEKNVFSACDEAIDELKNLIRIITNELSGVNILLTSDHGFLYTYSPLKEDDKADKKNFEDRLIEYSRRFAIMTRGEEPEYLQKIKLFDENTEYDAYSPREYIRIKMKGGGMNFVHGGASLQEMVVPVIEYHHLRSDSMEYKRNRDKYDTKPVSLALLSAAHIVSNMSFNLSFYQKEAVGTNRKATSFQIYFTDSTGKTVSDIVSLIADKTSDDIRDRTFQCGFNLKAEKFNNTEEYYLVIADDGGQILSREEFQIDISFSEEESDFFD